MKRTVFADQAALEAAIASGPGDKVTKDDIDERIKDVHYYHPPMLPGTLTICVIELNNGFTVLGQSACADPANFSVDIGMDLAYADAFKKLWPLFGFLLAEMRHLNKEFNATREI